MAASVFLPSGPLQSYNYQKKVIFSECNYSSSKISSSGKRKSAVELLQESKANYVKSEAVLDSQQHLKNTDHLRISPGTTFDILSKTRVPETKKHSSFSDIRNDHLSYEGRTRHSTVTLGCCNEFILHRNMCRTTSVGIRDLPSYKIVYNTYHPKTKNSESFNRSQDFRRSHHEKYSNDIQNKLRKLLNTDSKENVSNDSSSETNYVSCPKSFHKSIESLKVPCEPFLKPRHEQERNYALHKSMPDLSPNMLEISLRANPSDSEEDGSSMVVRPPKSIDGRRLTSGSGSRKTTSDYASRSPSSKQDYPNVSELCINISYNETANPNPCEDDSFLVTDEISYKKPILRSKSDVSYRYLRDREDVEYLKTRRSSDATGAESFFDSIGLGLSAFDLLTKFDSDGSSPVFFEADSSDDSFSSPCRRSCRTIESIVLRPGLRVRDVEKLAGACESSIVERNARVVKWLFACRRAQMSKCSV